MFGAIIFLIADLITIGISMFGFLLSALGAEGTE